jgi:hypothetical protein
MKAATEGRHGGGVIGRIVSRDPGCRVSGGPLGDLFCLARGGPFDGEKFSVALRDVDGLAGGQEFVYHEKGLGAASRYRICAEGGFWYADWVGGEEEPGPWACLLI